jgi:hypothetical protein
MDVLSAVCFAGVGGKFKSQMLDLPLLVLGALTLLTGVAMIVTSPRM